MNIGKNKTEARFVQKEAPKRLRDNIFAGGADKKDGYVLGLRFKPAPVFHFLGMGKYRAADCSGFWKSFPEWAKSGCIAVLPGGLPREVMFDE